MKEIHIFLLDDDEDTLELIVHEFKRLLATIPDLIIKTYTSVDVFFKDFSTNVYTALIDHQLGGTSGFGVVGRINEHNKQNPDKPCTIIIMSGTRDPHVAAHYMNTQTARFYVDKNDRDFYDQLVGFTQIAFEESANKREEGELKEAYMERQLSRKAFVEKYLSLMEAGEDGTN